MASKLRRRGKRSWEFAVSEGTTIFEDPVTGTRRRKQVQRWFTIQADSRKEAEAKMAQILTQLASGTYVEPSKLPLRDFLLNHFIPHLRAKHRSPSTIDSYTRIINKRIIPALGHLPLEKVTPLAVDTFLNNLKRKDGSELSARTVQYTRAILHRAFEYALEMELVARNPVSKVASPKVVRRKPDPFTRKELERILAVAPRYRIGALVTAAVYTGARLGELLALRWDAVDFDDNTLTFRRTLVDPGHQGEGRDPLFKESTKDDEVRVIPMAPELVAALRAWRKRWAEERMRAGGGYFDRFNLVFPTETGWPVSRHNVTRDFAALLKAAGVRYLSFHKLRHTFATRLLDAGADLDTVAELLGDDVKVVKDFYVGSRPEAMRAAVHRLAKHLCPNSAQAK